MPLTDTDFQAGHLLDQIPMGVVNVDRSGVITFINKSAGNILGVEKASLEGLKYFETDLTQITLDGNQLEMESQPLTRVLSGEGFVHDFVQGVLRKNTIVWISVEASPLYDHSGELTGAMSCFTDVTDKVLLEKDFEEEKGRYERINESIQAVFWEWSLRDDRMSYVGPKVEEMLGYTVEERSTKGFWEKMIHPEDKEWTISFHQNQVAAGQSHEFEYRFKKSDGRYIWIRDIIDVLVEDGKSVFLRGLMIDITRQKLISQKLRESEDLYKLLAENTSDLITLHNLDLSYKFVSPSILENLGYSETDLSARQHLDLIHPGDQKTVWKAYEKVVQGGRERIRYRMQHKDSSYLWFEGELNPVFDEEERILFIKNSSRQIHEQKIAEDKLSESETRNRSLISEAPFSVSIHNKEGILLNANLAFERTWDIKREGLIRKFNIRKEKKFQQPDLKEAIKKAFNGQKGDLITQFETVQNKVKDLQIKYFPLINSNKEIYSVVFLTEDITARIEAERKATEGEALKQGILNSLDDALLVVDKDGTIISINKRLQTYIHRSPYTNVEIGGNVFSFIDFFEEKELVHSGLEKVLNRTSTFFDYETKLADNKWYTLKVTQLKTPYGAVISWQNINTRKEIEIALEKSLKKYRNIYNRAPVMMHSINSKAEIMSVSDFWLEKMGYERKEVIGKKILDFVTEDSKKEAKKKINEFFSKGYLRNENYRFKTKSGETLEVLLSATSEYDEEGNFERSLAGMVDVTELRKTERDLLESQQNLIEAQRISKIGNYELDLSDYSFIPSPEVIAIMGLSLNHRNLSILDELIHPGDKAEFVQKLKHSAKTGADFFHVYRIKHLRSHKLRWITGRGKIKKNESGENYKMIGTVQDISEQKVAEDKIRRLSDRILLATELAEIGVWEFSTETGEVFWDKQMYEIFETLKKPITSFKDFAEFMAEEDRPTLWELYDKMKRGARFIEADLKLTINKKVRYLRTYNRVIRGEDARITRIIGVMYENTKDKELQLKLETSLEEKNILLKEVHHRVKNNMQLVSSILALKSYDLKDENSKEIFSEINERIKSMAVIHDQLYKFYNVSEINISEYLNHIARELSVMIGSGDNTITVDADSKLFEVDKALLFGLIVSELVSNAFKHSFSKRREGTVQIIFKSKGAVNRLSVLNNGVKIPVSILDDKSTGLGISLIKTFARQLNGELSLSEKNGFEIQFESK
ncbi:MAG: PAS domain S-box protein [Cyclobacteriaceae bacterium]